MTRGVLRTTPKKGEPVRIQGDPRRYRILRWAPCGSELVLFDVQRPRGGEAARVPFLGLRWHPTSPTAGYWHHKPGQLEIGGIHEPG